MSKALIISDKSCTWSSVSISYDSIANGTYFDTAPQTTTESDAQIKIRTDGIVTNLGVIISSNSATAFTITFRKNGANGNQAINVTGSTTGDFIDAVNSDSIISGDLINTKTPVLSGGTATYKSVYAVFSAKISTATIMMVLGVSSGVANETTFFASTSDPTNIGMAATESDVKLKIKNNGSLKYFNTNVNFNGSDNIATMRTRVNGANGNLVLSITALTTGIYEDNSNIDNILTGDDFNFTLVTGAGAVGLVCAATSITYRSTNGRYPVYGFANAYTGSGQNANLTRYVGLARGGTFATTENDTVPRNKSVFAQITRLMGTRVFSNGITATSTLRFRVNNANGNQVVSIGSGTTGYLEDTTNTDSLVGTETTDYQVITGATGTNIRFQYFHILFFNKSSHLLPLMGVGF